MLTARGWNLLLGDLTLLAAGVGFQVSSLALVGLTILIWFLVAWFLFLLRVRLAVRRMRAVRALSDANGPVRNLWAHGNIAVHVTLSSSAPLGLSYVRVTDRV